MIHPDEFLSRRGFLRNAGVGLGALAAARLPQLGESDAIPHIAPRAKRVIFLFMAGGPSQLDLFDPKPKLRELSGQAMPESVTKGQRVAQLRGRKLVIVGSAYDFAKHGQCGTEVSELLPYTARIVDDIAIVRSMNSEAINHDPGMTMMQTGFQQPGRPSMGAWVTHGLKPINDSLPPFIVLVSGATPGAQPLYSRLWSAGFLPGHHQGVQLRGGHNPVLFLENPDGIDRASRREILDHLRELNQLEIDASGDPAIDTRSQAYEMAFRMQESVPDLMNLGQEPQHILDMYGVEPGQTSFAANCLIARRLAERDVRFIQLYHRGWDHHEDLPRRLAIKCRETDQAAAALVSDLKQRGLLEDTLVIWGGEFGRTPMNQGDMSSGNYGRDHHGKVFSMWMAGGGIKPGVTVGESDDLGYDIVRTPVHVNDLHATALHCLGIEHKRLTFLHEGRDFRLTDVAGRVVPELLA